jgi:acetylornithine deacetylase
MAMSRFKDAADRSRIRSLLEQFVSIHSVNPALDGGPGEAELATAVFNHLEEAGLNPSRQAVHPGGRDNISASLEGAPGSPLLMWQAHLDTVTPSGKAWPKAVVEGTRVHGRGACDTKGSLVAMVEALRMVRALDPSERTSILFVGGIDEEVAGTGAMALCAERTDIDMAIVGEPTGLELATAHKGVLRFEIETVGSPAHSSKPHLGVNAIHKMTRVLDALERNYIPKLAEIDHPLVGNPTINTSLIRGGTALNIVPAQCVISMDRRVNPGEDSNQILADIEELLAGLAESGIETRLHKTSLDMGPLDTPVDHPLVKVLQTARQSILGEPGHPIGVPYGTDGAWFAPEGIPSVVFGPGSIDQAHSDEEWVEIEDTASAAEIIAETAVLLAG